MDPFNLSAALSDRPLFAGQTRLQQATASARLSEHRQLNFSVEVVPAEGHRQSGHVKAHGTVPLAETVGTGSSISGGSSGTLGGSTAAGSGISSATATQQQQQQPPGGQLTAVAAAQQQLDVRLSVKDGGMAVLTSVTPDLRWQAGQAAVDVRLRGSLDRPVLSGSATITKATLECPSLLRWPLTNVAAEVRAGGGMLTVESLEARCGRRGSLRLRGSLPVYTQQHSGNTQQQRHKQQKQGGGAQGGQQQAQQQQAHRLVAEASGLELRLRNMYSGQYDAGLVLTGSLASPTVAGSMRFSKGIVFIVPQGAPGGCRLGAGPSRHVVATAPGWRISHIVANASCRLGCRASARSLAGRRSRIHRWPLQYPLATLLWPYPTRVEPTPHVSSSLPTPWPADVAGTASGTSDTLLTPSGMGTSGSAGSVARVFDILTRGESGLAQQFEAVMKQEVGRRRKVVCSGMRPGSGIRQGLGQAAVDVHRTAQLR